jgi:hypothetical protein
LTWRDLASLFQVVVFALVAYCKDGYSRRILDLEQHDVSGTAERDDEFAQEWGVSRGLPAGEGKFFEQLYALRYFSPRAARSLYVSIEQVLV